MDSCYLLPFSADDGAVAYFGPEVGRHVAAIRRALRYAECRLYSLRALTDDPGTVPWHVEMELAEFLTWARQVRVSIHDAVTASPARESSEWWSALRLDVELARFTERRNRALKRVESASEARRIQFDVDGVPHAVSYFAFAEEPYAGDPVFPRCQKHFIRIRELAEEAQLLIPRAA